MIKSFRLYTGHVSMPNSPLQRTERVFRATNKKKAMKKAKKFVEQADLTQMVWELRQDIRI